MAMELDVFLSLHLSNRDLIHSFRKIHNKNILCIFICQKNMKNIISFDVGMKNLAYCIFQVCETNSKVKILKWDVINLCTPIVRKWNTLGCTQDAK
jgi:hypothetical protein